MAKRKTTRKTKSIYVTAPHLSKYQVVAVTFNGCGSSSKQYHYKAPANLELEGGDTVVVKSPYNGMTCCTVRNVLPAADAYSGLMKWIVDKVDTSRYEQVAQLELEEEQMRERERQRRMLRMRCEELINALPPGPERRRLYAALNAI